MKVPHSDHLPLWSSNHRHAVLNLLPRVESVSNVVAILGDQTDVMFSFYRDGGGKDEARTLATGQQGYSISIDMLQYILAIHIVH